MNDAIQPCAVCGQPAKMRAIWSHYSEGLVKKYKVKCSSSACKSAGNILWDVSQSYAVAAWAAWQERYSPPPSYGEVLYDDRRDCPCCGGWLSVAKSRLYCPSCPAVYGDLGGRDDDNEEGDEDEDDCSQWGMDYAEAQCEYEVYVNRKRLAKERGIEIGELEMPTYSEFLAMTDGEDAGMWAHYLDEWLEGEAEDSP